MQHSNHPALLIGSGVGVLAAAAITAGILTRNVLVRRRKAAALDDEPLEIDPEHPSNMEYLVSHNSQGF